MISLRAMEKIHFEDRTTETPEEKLEREVFQAGRLLVGFTIQVSGARPPVGLGALSYALGMGAARVGATLEDVIEAVKLHYEATQEAMKLEEVVVAAGESAASDA
jgi:hypothetical protein